jgi:hypothetical protein
MGRLDEAESRIGIKKLIASCLSSDPCPYSRFAALFENEQAGDRRQDRSAIAQREQEEKADKPSSQ